LVLLAFILGTRFQAAWSTRQRNEDMKERESEREELARQAHEAEHLKAILSDMEGRRRRLRQHGPDHALTIEHLRRILPSYKAKARQLKADKHQAIKAKVLEFYDRNGDFTEDELDEFIAELDDALKVIPPQ